MPSYNISICSALVTLHVVFCFSLIQSRQVHWHLKDKRQNLTSTWKCLHIEILYCFQLSNKKYSGNLFTAGPSRRGHRTDHPGRDGRTSPGHHSGPYSQWLWRASRLGSTADSLQVVTYKSCFPLVNRSNLLAHRQHKILKSTQPKSEKECLSGYCSLYLAELTLTLKEADQTGWLSELSVRLRFW